MIYPDPLLYIVDVKIPRLYQATRKYNITDGINA